MVCASKKQNIAYTDIEPSFYNLVYKKYEKEMKLEANADFYAVAFFFWTFLDFRKRDKPPITLVEKNGIVCIETSFSKVKDLKAREQQIIVALFSEIVIGMLKPKSSNVSYEIEQMVASLSTNYDVKKTIDEGEIFQLAAFFRDL